MHEDESRDHRGLYFLHTHQIQNSTYQHLDTLIILIYSIFRQTQGGNIGIVHVLVYYQYQYIRLIRIKHTMR